MGRTNEVAGTSRPRTGTSKAPQKEDPNKRPVTGVWDKEDTKFMAILKNVPVLPTRVASKITLDMLGLLEDVTTVFQTLGMGRLWRVEHRVYTKLVTEFIATCRLTYQNPQKPTASEGTLTFFLNKQHYSKTLFEICDMYGFTKGESVTFPKLSSEVANDFWNKIAVGPYQSRKAKITLIRSPVVRYVAKIISSVLYFKPVIASVTETELSMLFYGVKHLLEDYTDFPAPDANVAAILCDVLVKMKTFVPKSAAKNILAGTTLTPLFLGCRLDLSKVAYDYKQECMDIQHLYNTTYLKKGRVYVFTGRDGSSCFCKLPNRHITSLVSLDNLEFALDEQYLIPDPSGTIPRRRSHAQAPPTDEHFVEEDEIQEDLDDQAPPSHAQPYLLLPEDPGQFRLSPPPASNDISQQMAWMIASTKRNNSMMHRMWRAISRIRPCVCTRGEGSDDGDRENRSKATEDRHAERLIPAAGQSRASTSRRSQEHSPDTRLGRSRRQPGEQSSSESPTHHR
ncbi:unnamed protein product [Arabidopsis lyrata]|uniref:uncharacterized protein LOC110231116 n=1 Tax=Arabidopsis lyrata subsp. lyrata TaxID=81972 RepID=UPI000A29CB7A|nr:uncharacterized protein LOC110231116 [Arabidopsis lyrata subsp. lyrata]CAH8257992.1 unnamed protein product [Arabidopsis lyrata]|eukprot:XP_020891656.1 uncharacterized protein LOC110231116 [Arabidopsis lyrata subsp. lyrata]